MKGTAIKRPQRENNKEPQRDNICVIIVTYHPDADFPDRAMTAARQVGRTVIVDNNSSDQAVCHAAIR